MDLNQLVGWYQSHISKYDKNKWELSVEHKKLNGCGKYVRSTKQKIELIDVDLVRGSSFAKVKPKQSLFTVITLAFTRLFLLPVYSKWWVEQTSQMVYRFLLTLYVLQVVNLVLYMYITNYYDENVLSLRDIAIPNLLSFLLSVIHSQIVATAGSCNGGGKFGMRKRKLSKKSTRRNSVRESTPIICSAKKLSNTKVSRAINSPVNRVIATNCPTGLRKRNAEWNHIYSPFWLNANRLEPNVESEKKKNFDDPIVGSERSNIDHGFESFNGKSSSGEEPTSPTVATEVSKQSELKGNLLSCAQNVDLLSPMNRPPMNTVLTSPWLGFTSNSDCSYSSGSEYDSTSDETDSKNFPPPHTMKPSTVNDKISCTLWRNNRITKVEMSVLDISSVITKKVEAMTGSCDYIYIGILFSVLLSFVPALCRVFEALLDSTTNDLSIQKLPAILLEKMPRITLLKIAFGETYAEILLLSIGLLLRLCLTSLLFFMLTVAERTFKERLLYAKLFSHLTSSRRAKKSEVPHFRLSKLRNIKTWLSVRSYLKKRGPQRSVDVIVSATLMLSLVLVSFLCAESLNDSVHQHWQYDLEVFMWSCTLGCFILRFMTLGTAINAKYRSVSILITEQINLYLKMEQHPDKKQNLTAANSVLKLAADLLKELELPFKISGFNINPYLSAAIRVLIVSALSGVCSEMLGFKLKLFKLKES